MHFSLSGQYRNLDFLLLGLLLNLHHYTCPLHVFMYACVCCPAVTCTNTQPLKLLHASTLILYLG